MYNNSNNHKGKNGQVYDMCSFYLEASYQCRQSVDTDYSLVELSRNHNHTAPSCFDFFPVVEADSPSLASLLRLAAEVDMLLFMTLGQFKSHSMSLTKQIWNQMISIHYLSQ